MSTTNPGNRQKIYDCLLSVNNWKLHGQNVSESCLDDISGLDVNHARWRTGQDEVTRLESHHLADVAHYGGHGEKHVRGAGALAHFAVHFAPQVDVLWIWQLRHGHKSTHRTRSVKTLAQTPRHTLLPPNSLKYVFCFIIIFLQRFNKKMRSYRSKFSTRQ